MQLVRYLCSPRASKLAGKCHNLQLSAMPINLGVCEARMAAPPHHMWYEADIQQIATAELQAQDEKDVEALMLLATSLQVCGCVI
jgi:hypothetical protein